MGKKVLIIGAGPAGLAAADAAARHGAEVRLCGDEPYPPYWRPRLTHFLAEPAPAENLAVKKSEWYVQNGITLETGRKAVHVDTARKQVAWADGRLESYDTLVLAAGSEPNMPQVPGAEHAMTLRSYDDAVKIRKAALAAGRAVVIGGGLLGLETVWELNAAGVRSALVERNRWLMPRQLNRSAGRYLQARLETRGIQFIIGQDPSTLGDLYSGACVVLAAGVHAGTAFLEGSGITVGRAGVTVDDRMRTSAADVYACGDIAEYSGRSWGLIIIADAQGRVAGANAAGGEAAYVETPPSPILKTGDVAVFSVGDVSEGEGITSISEETPDAYKCLMVREGILAGAVLIGDTKAGMKLKKAVAEKRPVNSEDNIMNIINAL